MANIETTLHGDNIIKQIQGPDVYGNSGLLNPADVLGIIDEIHSSLIDNDEHNLLPYLESWMHELMETYEVSL